MPSFIRSLPYHQVRRLKRGLAALALLTMGVLAVSLAPRP